MPLSFQEMLGLQFFWIQGVGSRLRLNPNSFGMDFSREKLRVLLKLDPGSVRRFTCSLRRRNGDLPSILTFVFPNRTTRKLTTGEISAVPPPGPPPPPPPRRRRLHHAAAVTIPTAPATATATATATTTTTPPPPPPPAAAAAPPPPPPPPPPPRKRQALNWSLGFCASEKLGDSKKVL